MADEKESGESSGGLRSRQISEGRQQANHQHRRHYDEEIVHEFLHGYECLGAKVFTTKLGNQEAVSDLTKKHFKTSVGQDSSEIRVSAATILVLQKLGHLDILDIMASCADNLAARREKVYHLILDEMQKSRVQSMARSVYRFITTKFKI